MSSCNWEDLPNELLPIIGKHLKSRIDVFRFRSVSTSWRSVVSPSYRQNQSSLTPPPLPPVSTTALLSLVTICCLEHHTRNASCLVKVVESASGELQLLSPLSSLPLQQFPGNNKNNIRKTLNMLDFRLIELARGYHVPSNSTLKKVVLFYDYGILALFDLGKLRFWGFGDKEWTDLGDEGTHYDDVMAHKVQYYVIDNLGIISWIDKCRNLVQYSPPLCGFGQLKNLVVSDGEFYVVDSYLEEEEAGAVTLFEQPGFDRDRDRDRRRVDMKVYKLDEEWATWVEVKSIGDRVFVLGKEVCFSVCVKDFPGCQVNCIYFVDPSDRKLEFQTVSGSLKRLIGRVFRFDNGSIKTVECFTTYKRLFSPCMNWPLSVSSSPAIMCNCSQQNTGRLATES